jgi:hypothetical protein
VTYWPAADAAVVVAADAVVAAAECGAVVAEGCAAVVVTPSMVVAAPGQALVVPLRCRGLPWADPEAVAMRVAARARALERGPAAE